MNTLRKGGVIVVTALCFFILLNLSVAINFVDQKLHLGVIVLSFGYSLLWAILITWKDDNQHIGLNATAWVILKTLFSFIWYVPYITFKALTTVVRDTFKFLQNMEP